MPRDDALVTASGLAGDRQQDPRYHGGPDRAVLVYSLQAILALQKEGHPIRIGSAGENLTVSGLDWSCVVPGVRLRVGDVKLLVTEYTTPCYRISSSFLSSDFSRISQKLYPSRSRVSAHVITGGVLRVGDTVKIIEC